MPAKFDALDSAQPFQYPQPVIVPAPGDAWLVCISINESWVPYILGACMALYVESAWDTDDENVLNTMLNHVQDMIAIIASFEACPMPVQFRINPLDGRYWDYSNDGGASWTRQPDTVQQDIVIKDPNGNGNTVAAGDGFAGLIMNGLNFAAMLLKSNDTGLTVEKDASRAAIDSAPLVQIIGNDSYDYPLLEAGPM